MASTRLPADAGSPRRPGRPRGSVTQQGEATRQRILEVATELFADEGFHAATVAEIGERADVQVGALYYHIKSKEDLLWQILREYTNRALTDARSVASMQGDPVDKLRELIASHVRIIAAHRREVTIQVRDAEALTAAHAAQLQALRQGVQACWEQVLDEGYRAGKLTRPNRIVVSGLLGMVNAVMQWYRPEHGDTPAKIADELSAMVLDGLASGVQGAAG